MDLLSLRGERNIIQKMDINFDYELVCYLESKFLKGNIKAIVNEPSFCEAISHLDWANKLILLYLNF